MKRNEMFRYCNLTGNEIKVLREKLCLSKKEFALKLDISENAIWRYEVMGNEKPKMLFIAADNLEKLNKKMKGKENDKKSKRKKE